MKNRVLLICDPMTPPNYAPRVLGMCKYLNQSECEVTLEAGMLPAPRGLLPNLIDKLFAVGDRRFGRALLQKYPKESFDIIVCSTYYYFPLRSTLILSRAWDIPFVVDLRDIAEQWGRANYFSTNLPGLLGFERIPAKMYEAWNIRSRNTVLRKAAAVTTVSPWHRDYLQTLTKAPVHLIYNGFDDEQFHFTAQPSGTFLISYIGRLISPELRHPHILFGAVGELIREGLIKKVELGFWSEPQYEDEIRKLASFFGVDSILCWHPYAPREDVNGIMAESSIIVALGAPPHLGQRGILGTKVFEAMGVEKPFLLVPSDESSLAELIDETGVGCAASTVDQAKSFILQQYREWMDNGYTHRKITAPGGFTRRNGALQMARLLRSILHQ